MTVRAPWFVLLLFTLAIPAPLSAQSSTTGATRAPRRTASLAGRIIHPEGAAAEGARIAVYAVVEGAAGAIVATAVSNYEGRYEISGLPPGLFMVGVTALNGAGFGGPVKRPAIPPVETFYPGVVERDRAQSITTFEGLPTEGIDVWLAPAPQRFSISGRIYWPPDVQVERLIIEYGGPDAVRRGIWHVSDPGGLFTIDGVGPETYVLQARAETSTGPMVGLAATTVGIGPVEDLRLMLRPPGSIEGRIIAEGATPMPAAALRITPVQTLLTLSPLYPVADARVQDDGSFTIDQVMGDYTLAVEGLPRGWRVVRMTRDGAALPGDRLVVAAEERVSGVEIIVGRGSP